MLAPSVGPCGGCKKGAPGSVALYFPLPELLPQKMADLSPVIQPHREGGSRYGYTMFPGLESEAELSLSLASTKTRSYGSTGSVAAPLAERYIEHCLSPSDTLQGIALKYGVTMEQIKRANKLFSTDCIFLRKSLNIPVISKKGSLFNGLGSLDSPENETQDTCSSPTEEPALAESHTVSIDSSAKTNQPIVRSDEELSAKDFLQRLDLQIKRSTQAAQRLKEEDDLRHDDSYATCSYQH